MNTTCIPLYEFFFGFYHDISILWGEFKLRNDISHGSMGDKWGEKDTLVRGMHGQLLGRLGRIDAKRLVPAKLDDLISIQESVELFLKAAKPLRFSL